MSRFLYEMSLLILTSCLKLELLAISVILEKPLVGSYRIEAWMSKLHDFQLKFDDFLSSCILYYLLSNFPESKLSLSVNATILLLLWLSNGLELIDCFAY